MREVDWDKYDRATLDADVRKLWEAAIGKFFADRTRAEIGSEGLRRGINAAPASEPGDLIEHPQLKARKYFEPAPWPGSSESIFFPRYFLRTGAEE
jgi:crotonobetainyl-CoA:carnitine CoA-transferase CaiB-like acyl-CoA transferase